ncbi:hypothetical protein [Shewanella algae]|nr:hypothetical protein [Shewanella algae]
MAINLIDRGKAEIKLPICDGGGQLCLFSPYINLLRENDYEQ